LPKSREAGEAVIRRTPFPVRATTWGLLVAPSLMVSVPVRGPVALGLKTTFTVQNAEGASEAPHVLLGTKKSPEALTAPIPSV
jgi:hypothetical protein